MERDYDCLFHVSSQRLVMEIAQAARYKAMTYPEIQESKNGCTRITMAPLSSWADAWLGGIGDFDANDVCEREMVYKLHPEGSHTMQYVCEDKTEVPVNCYAYSALKVAFVSFLRKCKRKVADLPATVYIADNGWARDEGTVYMTVYLDGEAFLRLYVTVSGFQKGEDDEICAIAGLKAAQDFLVMLGLDLGVEFTFEEVLHPLQDTE